MRPTFPFAAVLALVLWVWPAFSQQDADAPQDKPLLTEAESLEPFKWVARPVVVFADSPNDPRYIEQIQLLERRKEALFDRDVVVIADTKPSEPSEIRRRLRPRGFMLALVGKDGEIKLRKPVPWDVREITRVIDKFPLRQQEIRDANRGAGAG